MIIPDINLLVYAYNQAVREHPIAKTWWETLLNDSIPVGIPWVVSIGFIRIATHPRVLQTPVSADRASQIVQSWLDCSNVIIPEPGDKFSKIFLNQFNSLGTAGNLTTDAYLAALAIESQSTLASNDTDFARFEGLKWENPLA